MELSLSFPESMYDVMIMGAVLKVQVKRKTVILEPFQEPPKEAFVQAGSKITEPLLNETKATSDKARRPLRDLSVPIG